MAKPAEWLKNALICRFCIFRAVVSYRRPDVQIFPALFRKLLDQFLY